MNENVEITSEDMEDSKVKSNRFINFIILFVIFVVSIFMYAKYVGTKGLVVKEYLIKDKGIPSNFSGVKVVYFSDLLYGSTTNLEDLENLVLSINERNVDLVLFGGGLIDSLHKLNDKDKNEMKKLFGKIESKLGNYAVKGHEENENFDEILSDSFEILNNSYDLIYNDDNTPICLSGVGSYNAGDYDFNSSFSYPQDISCYIVMFTHEADIVDKVLTLEKKPDIILAGNSLGGEINIPFYGPVYKFSGSKKYYLDYYKIGETKVFVSSGIGTKKSYMRIFNSPSFNFFRLKSLT